MSAKKVIICGNSWVGKTTLLCALAGEDPGNANGPTLASGFRNINVQHGDNTFPVNFWDTAGQEAYRSLIKIYFRDSDIAIIVFDISSRQSFEQIQSWVDMIKENTYGKYPAGILVANKCDLEDHEVPDEEIAALAKQYGISWFKVSASKQIHIDLLSLQIGEILSQREKDIGYHALGIAPEEKETQARVEPIANKDKPAEKVEIKLTDNENTVTKRGCFC